MVQGNDILSTATCKFPKGKATVQTSVLPVSNGHTISVSTLPQSSFANGVKILVEHVVSCVDKDNTSLATTYEISWNKGRPALYKQIEEKIDKETQSGLKKTYAHLKSLQA